MSRIPVRRVVAACAAALALATGSAAVASTGSTSGPVGGVGLQPAHPSSATPGYFRLTVRPGHRVYDSVAVTNTSAHPVSLVIYPVDALTGATTGTVFSLHGRRLRQAGRWVREPTHSLRMVAKSTVDVGFSYKVPAHTRPGDYMAGIAFQNRNATKSKKPKHGKPIAVKQLIRTVIAVEMIVPGPAVFLPRLTSLTIRGIGATGMGAIYVGLGNRGSRIGTPILTVSLSGPRHYRGHASRQLNTVLPGALIAYPFNWRHRLARGHYRITATLRAGGRKVVLHRRFFLRHALGAAVARKMLIRARY